ncbi:hypothetical protein [Streptococcus sp. A22]|uniref:hypothetical protein n=1 Tax=Streptococcus sp. A22 TaxID=3373126 RepID=UPI00374CFCCE
MKKLTLNEASNVIGGVGFQWKCKTTGWESGWHLTYGGAAKFAYAHEQKYSGHKTVVFPV